MEEKITDFMSLKLSPGQLFQLEFDSYGDDRDKSILIGYRRNATILVTMPVGRRVKVEDKVNVRFFYGRKSSACAFQTEIVYFTKYPFPHIHLKMPDQVVVDEVRHNVRTNVDMHSKVEFKVGDKSEHTTAKIVDLSINGARILGRTFNFGVDDEILLTFVINVTNIEHEMTVPATVRSVHSIEKGLAVGLEFKDLPTNDKIALQAFVLSHLYDL